MRVGVLTGGGDCPGLNAVIRAVVRKGVGEYGFDLVGFKDGWRGPLENVTTPLGIDQVRGILPRGGTILKSSRTNPFRIDNGVEKIKENLAANGVDALIAIGGEDTLGVATRLADEGVAVVGVPKTIDNDLSGTDFTFGFDTAVKKPNVKSVAPRSLSIVLGTPTTGTPSSVSLRATPSVSSPPIAINARTPRFSSVERMRCGPSGSL